MGLTGSAYLLAGLFGYLTFLDNADADLLKNFHVSGDKISTVMDVVRLGFGASLVFSYPIVLWEARKNLDVLIFGKLPYKFKRYLVLNISIISCTTLIGVVAPGIDSVLGLVGSTCSPMMVFILPSLFYLESYRINYTSSNTLWCREVLASQWKATTLLVFGTTLIPVCITAWILNTVLDPSAC